jgi:hypothetical protein
MNSPIFLVVEQLRRPCAVLTLAAYVLLAASSSGQTKTESQPKAAAENQPADAAKPDEPTETLIIHPALPPKPALKYRLYPRYIEQSPGNAAPQYMKAALSIPADARKLIGDEKFEAPLKKFPIKVAKDLMQKCRLQLDLIHLASRRMICDWELPLREGKWINVLLPEIQEQRQLARLIHTKIRLELAEGKMDEAIDSTKTLFALGRHVAEGPTLINALVGVAITNMALGEVRELSQQPDCPNLYWALTVLPNPFIDIRPALEMEGDGIYYIMPSLKEVRGAKLTEEGWNKTLIQTMKEFTKLGGGPPADDEDESNWKAALASIAGILVLAPQSREELKSLGYTDEQLKPMPPAQIILLAMVESYEATRDHNFKWMSVPYHQAIDRIQDAERTIKKRGTSPMPSLAALLMPALSAARTAVARNDREIAATRCVEAIRLYAAEHGDKLPENLSDISEVPIPDDPMTGKPFLYQLKNGGALLESLIPENQQLRWQIQIAPAKRETKGRK